MIFRTENTMIGKFVVVVILAFFQQSHGRLFQATINFLGLNCTGSVQRYLLSPDPATCTPTSCIDKFDKSGSATVICSNDTFPTVPTGEYYEESIWEGGCDKTLIGVNDKIYFNLRI